MPVRERLLFICTYNICRSLTAERLFQDHAHYEVRSAGTHHSAVQKVDAEVIRWADRVVVMEEAHQLALAERFPEAVAGKTIVCLEIPDDYQPLAEDLVRVLTERLRGVGIEWEEPEHGPAA